MIDIDFSRSLLRKKEAYDLPAHLEQIINEFRVRTDQQEIEDNQPIDEEGYVYEEEETELLTRPQLLLNSTYQSLKRCFSVTPNYQLKYTPVGLENIKKFHRFIIDNFSMLYM